MQTGIISDDELLELLDVAFSPDTSSTVRMAREMMKSRIDPMQLTSQLANLIVDILAGKLQDDSSEVRKRFIENHSCKCFKSKRIPLSSSWNYIVPSDIRLFSIFTSRVFEVCDTNLMYLLFKAEADLQMLGRALKILSETEKQLRVSKNQSTWLTAALLQFSSLESNMNPVVSRVPMTAVGVTGESLQSYFHRTWTCANLSIIYYCFCAGFR